MEELNQIFSNGEIEITKDVWAELVKEVDENGDGEVINLFLFLENDFFPDFIQRVSKYDGEDCRREDKLILLHFF